MKAIKNDTYLVHTKVNEIPYEISEWLIDKDFNKFHKCEYACKSFFLTKIDTGEEYVVYLCNVPQQNMSTLFSHEFEIFAPRCCMFFKMYPNRTMPILHSIHDALYLFLLCHIQSKERCLDKLYWKIHMMLTNTNVLSKKIKLPKGYEYFKNIVKMFFPS